MARPRQIETPEEFDMLVDIYVAQCIEEDKPLSIPGLALALGLCSKSNVYAYSEKEGFKESVERAKTFIEQQHYDNATTGKAHQGNVFLLKSVYNYQEKQVVDHNMTVNIDSDAARIL